MEYIMPQNQLTLNCGKIISNKFLQAGATKEKLRRAHNKPKLLLLRQPGPNICKMENSLT